MTITLPDELRDEQERKTRAAGFTTIAEYVCWLVQRPEAEEDVTPKELGLADPAGLETKLLASLSPQQRPADSGDPGVLERTANGIGHPGREQPQAAVSIDFRPQASRGVARPAHRDVRTANPRAVEHQPPTARD